ncbi:hypothetical protein GH733_002772, partial [Mirounga leonina]
MEGNEPMWTLSLRRGFELEIVNNCEENNHGCSHHCEHVLGGRGGGADLDECESGEVRCAQLRINYLGNYKCRCQEGFISSDGDGCDALTDGELEEEELEVEPPKGFFGKNCKRKCNNTNNGRCHRPALLASGDWSASSPVRL